MSLHRLRHWKTIYVLLLTLIVGLTMLPIVTSQGTGAGDPPTHGRLQGAPEVVKKANSI